MFKKSIFILIILSFPTLTFAEVACPDMDDVFVVDPRRSTSFRFIPINSAVINILKQTAIFTSGSYNSLIHKEDFGTSDYSGEFHGMGVKPIYLKDKATTYGEVIWYWIRCYCPFSLVW